jgi:hypothetical protein
MNAPPPHLDKFARSLCRSLPGSSSARLYAQTIKPKLQKIQPPNSKAFTVATTRVAQRSPQPPHLHDGAPPAALKSP